VAGLDPSAGLAGDLLQGIGGLVRVTARKMNLGAGNRVSAHVVDYVGEHIATLCDQDAYIWRRPEQPPVPIVPRCGPPATIGGRMVSFATGAPHPRVNCR
jgi:hypothetical protein